MTWDDVFGVVGRSCLDVPEESSVEFAMTQRFRQLSEDPNATFTDLRRVKLQFYCLGLIRTEMVLRASEPNFQGKLYPPQPTLCWMLTDAGRRCDAEP